MNTIDNLKKLKSELEPLVKIYSGTLASILLDEEIRNISKVIKFLETQEERINCLYYKHILKSNDNYLSDKELKRLNNNWLNSKDMIELCNKYNIEYNVIEFNK